MMKHNNNYTILIVEDNEGDYIIVEEHLNEKIPAPSITRAKHAAEAEAKLKSAVVPFDVILLDQRLPDKSGQNLVTQMLRAAGGTPIVILTAYSDFNFSVNTIGQGISDYLSKDNLTAAGLYKSIIYAIERKKMISEIAESEKRFSALFSLSPVAMWVFDINSLCILTANKATTDLLEFSEEELLRMTILDIRKGEGTMKKGESAHNLKIISSFDKKDRIFFNKSGKPVTLDLSVKLITFKEKNACFVVALNVTDKRQEENRITRAIIHTQENERTEMGRELHDNICQILAAGRMNLDMLLPSVSPDKIAVFEESMSNIKLAADEIRNLSHRLAPAFYDISDMQDAFYKLVKSYDPPGKLKCSIKIDEKSINNRIPRVLQLNMYRILQEQLSNIIKHANATAVKIDISVIDSSLEMKIIDNGIGCDPAKKRNGIGLNNIEKRAELFGGKADFISAPGKGCTIHVHIPLKQESV